MAELTLESLAARVEALERESKAKAGYIRLKNGTYARPGTGDWDAALRAIEELRKTYDFDAIAELDRASMAFPPEERT